MAVQLSNDERHKLRIERFKDFLSAKSLYKLDSVPLKKKSDGTFIRKALIELYGGDTEGLRNRSLFGRKGMQELSPDKVNVLRKLIDERVSMVSDGDGRNEVSYVNNQIYKQLSYIRKRDSTFE